jgi:hypothetical protein
MVTLHIETTGAIVADFRKSHTADTVRNLFGTHRIPTPFTFHRVTNADRFASIVITEIRRLNPDESVEWSRERCEEFTAFRFLEATLKDSNGHDWNTLNSAAGSEVSL